MYYSMIVHRIVHALHLHEYLESRYLNHLRRRVDDHRLKLPVGRLDDAENGTAKRKTMSMAHRRPCATERAVPGGKGYA